MCCTLNNGGNPCALAVAGRTELLTYLYSEFFNAPIFYVIPLSGRKSDLMVFIQKPHEPDEVIISPTSGHPPVIDFLKMFG